MFVDKLTQLRELRTFVNEAIDARAREIAEIRGIALKGSRSAHKFDSFTRSKMQEHSGNTRYYGVHYPIAYPLDTPTIRACFTSMGYEGHDEEAFVEFPVSYMDDSNWRETEVAYVEAVNQAREEKMKQEQEEYIARKHQELARLQRELGLTTYNDQLKGR